MEDYREFAIWVAQEAGKLIMKNHGKIQKLEWTSRTHFRTEVDRASDALIRQRIREFYPGHSIYSEENRALETGSGYKWVCDPLDGTIPWTFGFSDYFSVCIALVRGRTPIVGVINAVKRDELYVAVKGEGAFCNNEPIKVSSEDNINHVIMGLDSRKEMRKLKRLITCFLASGCASVPLCLVASGRIHAYLSDDLKPWDMAAAVVINREAEAKVTNINGKEWKLGDKSILVANPKLHSKLLKET